MSWRHSVNGMIFSGEFISPAEETGIIMQIGEWVFQTACIDATTWPADEEHARGYPRRSWSITDFGADQTSRRQSHLAQTPCCLEEPHCTVWQPPANPASFMSFVYSKTRSIGRWRR